MRCLILLDSAWSLRERWKIDLSFGTYLYFASNSVLTRYLTIIKTCVLRNCCYSYPAVILLFCDTAIVALPELSKIFVQWSMLNYILTKIWADFLFNSYHLLNCLSVFWACYSKTPFFSDCLLMHLSSAYSMWSLMDEIETWWHKTKCLLVVNNTYL